MTISIQDLVLKPPLTGKIMYMSKAYYIKYGPLIPYLPNIVISEIDDDRVIEPKSPIVESELCRGHGSC